MTRPAWRGGESSGQSCSGAHHPTHPTHPDWDCPRSVGQKSASRVDRLWTFGQALPLQNSIGSRLDRGDGIGPAQKAMLSVGPDPGKPFIQKKVPTEVIKHDRIKYVIAVSIFSFT